MPGASILLLEDDTELRDLLTEALTDDGYVVRACASVDDLRQVGSDGRPTLAIVDAWGQSYATLSDVERREIQDVARGVPTIMVTARGWAQTMQPADLGVLGLVRKPFDLDELLALIAELTEGLLRDSAQARAEAHRVRSEVLNARERLRRASRRLKDIKQPPEPDATA